jgi:hypothetical protein
MSQSAVNPSSSVMVVDDWHTSAPEGVRRAIQAGQSSEAWLAWRTYLAQQSRLLVLDDLLASRQSWLLWALPDGIDDRYLRLLLRQITQLDSNGSAAARKKQESRLGLSLLAWTAPWRPDSECDERFACETLAWCYALPRLAEFFSAATWWGLLDFLLGVIHRAAANAARISPLVHQWLAGEAGLAMACLFPEIVRCRALGSKARAVLSAGLIDLLDGEGLPHSRNLGILRPLLACWTRCRAMGSEAPEGCFTEAAGNQYEWLVRNALRWSRPDGAQILTPGSAGAWCEDLFQAALRWGGDEDDRDIAALVLPRPKRAASRRVANMALPEAATHSQWAAAAILRAGWSPRDPQFSLVYPDGVVRAELRCGREILFSGDWDLEIRRDGKPVRTSAGWQDVCWISDESADYLELEKDLGDGLRIQRHALLAREDHFLILADGVIGDRPAKLEYRSTLPLAGQISFRPAGETHDGLLTAKKPLALVLPLALPEWRSDPRPGTLAQTRAGLELRRQASARSLWAPLFFDLQPGRFGKPFTWRHLTVAENLLAQPADVAVGYRVTIGKDQWLLYHSLGPRGNRTLLGHNLVSQTLVARFRGDGEIEPVLEIE